MAVALALSHVEVPWLFAVMIQPIFEQFSAITRKSKMVYKTCSKINEGCSSPDAVLTEYASFAIVSRYCFRQGIYTT